MECLQKFVYAAMVERILSVKLSHLVEVSLEAERYTAWSFFFHVPVSPPPPSARSHRSQVIIGGTTATGAANQPVRQQSGRLSHSDLCSLGVCL